VSSAIGSGSRSSCSSIANTPRVAGRRPPGGVMDLPSAVHVRRDADVDAESLGGALEGRAFFLGGLVLCRALQFSESLGTERRGPSVGLCLRHGSHDIDPSCCHRDRTSP
jgi:hypothetical protein